MTNVSTPGRTAPSAAPDPVYPVFGLPKAHVRMLDDRARTQGYIDALRALVRPGDVVVDIGTGSGVFALAAAVAGAGRVYAVEAGRMADTAESLFRGNGYGDTVTVVRQRSTEVELPERADLIVSEVIGREPLEQFVMEICLDARERLLKPGGLFVPSALSLHALPVCVPPEELDRMDFTPAAVERWRSWYGMDFGPLLHTPLRRLAFKDPHVLDRWARVADPVDLGTIDFATNDRPVVDAAARTVATRAGLVTGVVLSFDLHLAPGNVFSTHPDRPSATNSWRYAVFFCAPFEVGPGQELEVTYQYGVPDVPDGAGARAV